MFLPKKNRLSYWKHELHDQLAVLMGGRVAEEVFVGDVSSGAQQDIERATQLARSMVCKWGMSDKLGPIAYNEGSEGGGYGGYGMGEYHEKAYSDETAKVIDAEVRQILDAAHELARKIILEYRDQVELMTQMLIEFETLDSEDVQEIVINKTWNMDSKREKLKKAAELYKKDPAGMPPPPPPIETGASPSSGPLSNSLGLSS
jgi:cell division protease FtsH